MSLDFTLTKYRELCEVISNSKYKPMGLESYLTQKEGYGKIIILRHDVDSRPEHSLRIAEIEKEYKLRSTYYFRMTEKVFQQDIIDQIQSLGHEIGYHYEVLDKAKGDFETAIKIFEEELEEFGKICDIRTICMHGNSRTPWNSRDIWKKYDFTEFGVMGEAYLSVDFSKLMYFSDSARTWDRKYKVKDVLDESNESNMPKIRHTNEIIDFINNEQYDGFYILTHPDEWTDSSATWLWDLVRQSFRNRAKLALKWWFERVRKKNI